MGARGYAKGGVSLASATSLQAMDTVQVRK